MFPSDYPDITLVFRGLFLIAFEKEKRYCQFGVIQAERHCLKIAIKTSGSSLPDAPEFSCKIPGENIHFEVTSRASGVDTYEPGPFQRNRRHDRRDFRWLLDFEGRELHNRQLPVKGGSLKRSVFVYNGLFYTRDTEEVIIRRPSHHATGTADVEGLLPQTHSALICKSIGCDIYLTGQEEFLFKYGPEANYSIRLKKEQGISYEISVTNLCPGDVEHEPPDGSDFALYYDTLDVPENEQFRVSPSPGPGVKNDSIPCDPTRISITKADIG
jgi:hypothetical protein